MTCCATLKKERAREISLECQVKLMSCQLDEEELVRFSCSLFFVFRRKSHEVKLNNETALNQCLD